VPIYEVEATVRVTLNAPNTDEADERAREQLEEVCSDVRITAIM